MEGQISVSVTSFINAIEAISRALKSIDEELRLLKERIDALEKVEKEKPGV